MTQGLAIDPGSTQSAIIVYDDQDHRPEWHDIMPNRELLERLRNNDSALTIGVAWFACEWMQPRGMPSSSQEFETLFWIGRYAEALERQLGQELERITRLTIKKHVCGNPKANDANIRAALIDRWGGIGGKEVAIGRKATPGPLYGIHDDEWAALAVAVTAADTR